MKFTRSLPAKASARANVPIITTTLNTFTFSQWSICIRMVNPMNAPHTILSVWLYTILAKSLSMNELPFSPFISMK